MNGWNWWEIATFAQVLILCALLLVLGWQASERSPMDPR